MNQVYGPQDEAKVAALARKYLGMPHVLRKEIRRKKVWGHNTDYEEIAFKRIQEMRNSK